VESVVPSIRLAGEQQIEDADGIIEFHIRRTAELLLDRSPVIAGQVMAGQCAVVGMFYQLGVGRVRTVTGLVAGNGQVEMPASAHGVGDVALPACP
jgi:carbonic anhydrase